MGASTDGSDLQSWQASYGTSPYRYQKCKHGHDVDLATSPWRVKRTIQGRHVDVECMEPCEKCTDPYRRSLDGTNKDPCKSGVLLDVPHDPATKVATQYPRHTSTAWRDSAATLPFVAGAYTRTIELKKQMFKPNVYQDHCLVFTADGDIFDFVLRHEGYDQESFRSSVERIVTDFRPRPGRWRGLYRVDGSTLTCSLTREAGERYGYSGTLAANPGKLKLKPLSGRHKMEFTFRPLALQMPVIAALTPPSVPVTAPRSEPVIVAQTVVKDETEQGIFEVILEDARGRQVQVIKALRKVAPLGLKEAKDLVDSAPSLVLHRADRQTADRAKVLLEQAGAQVTLRSG
jgi:large subunit ribosomal protein L7/L12